MLTPSNISPPPNFPPIHVIQFNFALKLLATGSIACEVQFSGRGGIYGRSKFGEYMNGIFYGVGGLQDMYMRDTPRYKMVWISLVCNLMESIWMEIDCVLWSGCRLLCGGSRNLAI